MTRRDPAGGARTEEQPSPRGVAGVVGVVGLGLLGAALVERLLAAGMRVVGCDLDATRAYAAGIEAIPTPGGLAARVEHVILCLPDSNAVAAVVEGADGILAAGRVDAGEPVGDLPRAIIDCTTGDPDAAAALADRVAQRGVEYVEAAVSGSSEVVRAGDGVLLVGGNEAGVAAVADILDAIAPVVFVLGPPGAGARMKLATNLVLGLNRLALAEGLAFAERLGLGGSAFLEVVRAGPAHSRALEAKGDRMLLGAYEPQARLAQHLKDVRLLLTLAERVGASLPTTRIHAELLERAVALGYADADNAAIVEVLRASTHPTRNDRPAGP